MTIGAGAVYLVANSPHAWSQARVAVTHPTWNELTPTQRSALEPLKGEWDRVEADRKRKWIEIADRMPKMPSAERTRIQQRMRNWAKMTPAERAETRRNYQELKKTPPDQRQRAWERYQQLAPEERRQLADEARRKAQQQRNSKTSRATNSASPTD